MAEVEEVEEVIAAPSGRENDLADTAEVGSEPAPTTSSADVPIGSSDPPGRYNYGPMPGYGPPPGQGPPPTYGWPGWPEPAASPPSSRPSRGRLSALVRNAVVAWVVAGVLALTVAGLSLALSTTSSASAPTAPSPARPGFFGGGLGNLGVFGTVASVGAKSFTVTTRAGGTVTVDEESSTTYYSGTTSTSSSAVVKGASVAVQGTRSGNTVAATRVDVLPAGGFGGGPFG